MKRNFKRTIYFATLLLSLAAVATAQNDGNCTAAALAGTWGHTGTGTLILPAGPVPFAFVGRITSDTAGNLSGTQTSSVGGQVSQETVTGTGTLNSDCTTIFSVSILDQSGNVLRTAYWAGVLVDNRRELRAIMTSLVVNGTSVPAVMTMNAKKLFPSPGQENRERFPARGASTCSPVLVAGTWGYTETGTLYLPPGAVPYASVGRYTLDVDGNLSGERTASAGGTILKATIKGTATVNPDCTGTETLNFYDEAGKLTGTAVKAVVYADSEREARKIIVPGARPAVLTTEARKLFPGSGDDDRENEQ